MNFILWLMIEEEIEDDLRSIFEELYQDPIKIAKHNKELKKMVEASNL